LNVIEQCLNVFKTGAVQRKRIQVRQALVESGKVGEELAEEVYPRIHGMVFNPADGVLKRLPVDFEKSLGSLDHIYGLYDSSFAL
jgi:carbonic anhydrase